MLTKLKWHVQLRSGRLLTWRRGGSHGPYSRPLPGNVVAIYGPPRTPGLWIASSAMPLCHLLTSFSHLSRAREKRERPQADGD